MEFAFMDPNAIEQAHREYAYQYELGREASQRGKSPSWLWYLGTLPVIGTRFPATPWLGIPASERSEFVRTVVDGIGRYKVRFAWLWSLSERQSFGFCIKYPLKREEDRDRAAEWQDHEMCEPCKNLMRSIRQWQNDRKKDRSMPYIGGYIDLSLPDQIIVSEFQARLADVRERAPKRILKKRSGSTPVVDKLLRLAAARLLRLWGTPTRVEDRLSEMNVSSPYSDSSGWYRAKKFVEQELSKRKKYQRRTAKSGRVRCSKGTGTVGQRPSFRFVDGQQID